MTIDFAEAEFDDSNPQPRCPCVLLLDTSLSMADAPIDALNQGLVAFRDDLNRDELAQLRVEIAIVTFGGRASLVQNFVTADQFNPPVLTVDGATPMGEGIELALDLIDRRKQTYRTQGVAHFRPWVFMITDGAPTDGARWQDAASRVQAAEAAKKVSFFAIGVAGADMGTLAQIGPRQPVRLDGLRFGDMFQWLSTSLKSVSHSEPGAAVPLQAPIGWTST